MINFLFTADIHANKTRLDKVIQFFEKCKKIITDKKINYFVIGGDLWNAMISNSKASGFVDILNEINDITKMCKVVAIYGTSSHEISGSLDCLIPLGVEVYDKNTLIEKDGIKILCIPEPRRSNYVRPTAQETTEAILEDLNKAFDNKADLIFFHGEISGAVLQNGTTSKSDIQVTQEMFKRCGAQLMLAGHIHNPQDVFTGAHYVGSPIPCTYGEGHDGSVYTFSFNGGKVTNLERNYLNFPINKMMDIESLELFEKLSKFNFSNNNVKVRLKLSPEEKLKFNIREEAKKLKEATGAEEVVINVSSKSEVSIRSTEIHKAKSIQEKLKIYSEINQIELSEDVISKAKELEDNLLIQYLSPTHSFELISLSLRGAKGIKGKEEININFKDYESGVIALIGDNGSGKSTLLENSSPFPHLITRSRALRSHFYLKDSHRIVVYRDENGLFYRFTIQLAAHIDTGIVKYFAETSEDGENWTSVPGVDGNLDSYNEYIKGLFGSVEVYLRTAFFTKGKVKGVNDIATATKSERIQLLSDLLGLDSLTELHDMVKDKLKDIKKEIDSLDNIEEKYAEVQCEIDKKNTNKKNYESELNETEAKLEEIESSIKNTKIAKENFNKNYAKFGNAIEMKTNCENEIAEITEHLDKLKEHKTRNDFCKNNTKQIDEYKTNLEEYKPLKEKLDKLSKEYHKYSEDFIEISNSFNSIQSKKEIEENKLNSVDGRIKSAEESLIQVDDFCPTCGAKLSASKKKDLIKAQSYQVAEIESLKEFKETQKKIISDIKKQYTDIKKKFEKAKLNKENYKKEYDELDRKVTSFEVYFDMNEQYKDFIDYVIVGNLEEDIERFQKSLDSNLEMLKTFEGLEFVDYDTELEKFESERKEYENYRLKYSVDIASLNTEIKQLEDKLQSMKEDAGKMDQLSKDFKEYSILEEAFSNSGIQALELESVVPEIALLTNQILNESYGDKFSVAFTTLKESRNKIIDDFSIDVTNHETGWVVPIETLSEGEKVWITQALYFAFSITRMQRTGFNYAVRFADESDGALDSEARGKYINMISSAHKAGNSRLTIIVTHSQEVKDIVNQTIQM